MAARGVGEVVKADGGGGTRGGSRTVSLCNLGHHTAERHALAPSLCNMGGQTA
jgi:hypothetical protein